MLLFLISYFKFLHEGFSTRPTTQLKAINFQKNFFLYKDTCHIVKSANIIPSPLLALTNLSSKKAAKKGPLSALQSLHNITKSYISHKQMIVLILLSLKFLKNQKGKNEKTWNKTSWKHHLSINKNPSLFEIFKYKSDGYLLKSFWLFTFGVSIHITLLKSLSISLFSDVFVAFSPSVSCFNGTGWKIKLIQLSNDNNNNIHSKCTLHLKNSNNWNIK